MSTLERLEIKADLTVSDEGRIEGIAWPFSAGPDRTGDTITRGAFNIVGPDLPILLAHDPEAVLGTWDEVRETERGLEVKGQLAVDEIRRAKAVRSLVMSGLMGGLSIGYRATASTGKSGRDRVISALDLLEVSIVRNPAHPRARITGAKSVSHIAEAIHRVRRALTA